MSSIYLMSDEHVHEYNWTAWQEGPKGVTHMMEYKDYKCACGDIKGRDTRNGRELTDEERGR